MNATYLFAKELSDGSIHSVTVELDAPEYMHKKWFGLVVQSRVAIFSLINKGNLRYTARQSENDWAIFTAFEESPLTSTNPFPAILPNFESWEKATNNLPYIARSCIVRLQDAA